MSEKPCLFELGCDHGGWGMKRELEGQQGVVPRAPGSLRACSRGHLLLLAFEKGPVPECGEWVGESSITAGRQVRADC